MARDRRLSPAALEQVRELIATAVDRSTGTALSDPSGSGDRVSLNAADREMLRGFVDRELRKRAAWIGFPTTAGLAVSFCYVLFVLPGIAADKVLKQWKLETDRVQKLDDELSRAKFKAESLASTIRFLESTAADFDSEFKDSRKTLETTLSNLEQELQTLRNRFDTLEPIPKPDSWCLL